jgi:hypothetical protein
MSMKALRAGYTLRVLPRFSTIITYQNHFIALQEVLELALIRKTNIISYDTHF